MNATMEMDLKRLAQDLLLERIREFWCPRSEREACAALMAAAPALLEAAEAAKNERLSIIPTNEWYTDSLLCQLRAAIAQARGENQEAKP